jgi:predicted ArsR family transcriptional regulator
MRCHMWPKAALSEHRACLPARPNQLCKRIYANLFMQVFLCTFRGPIRILLQQVRTLHINFCTSTVPHMAIEGDRPAPEEVSDVGPLKALAHTRRQAILQQLDRTGPATSTGLARDLGWNTGATSYHLRELARYGFVEELPERARGRERWWRAVRHDLRFPRRSQQSREARAVIDEMNRRSFADDFEAFTRMQAESAEPGDWGDAYPFSRGSINVTVEELAAFFEQYIELLKRYQRPAEDAPEDARLVLTRFFAFPAPPSGAAT